MKTIKIIIERGADNFGAYAENAEGVTGAGDTVEEAKQSIYDCIEIVKGFDEKNVPAVLKGEYQVIFNYDAESFFNYYSKIFTLSALERITGINQKQLQHYSSGLHKPRRAQMEKIKTSLHKLGAELMAIEI